MGGRLGEVAQPGYCTADWLLGFREGKVCFMSRWGGWAHGLTDP